MRFSVAVAALVSVVSVSAVDHVIKVGAGGLAFDPTEVTAAAGDTLSFQFQGKNHTVTQSTFAAPCQRMTTPVQGVDSGFMPVAAGATSLPQWTITVQNASAPLWFFCAQTGHCADGMVFAVNPTPEKSFAMFQAAAKAGGNSTTGSSTSSTATSTGAGTGGAAGTIGTTGTGASTSTAPSATNSSGAMRIGGAAAGVMTAAAIFVSLVL